MLDISKIADQHYIPTSVEVKRVLIMYFLIGIMIQLAKSHLTIYEYQHLKQSLGRAVIVILIAIGTSWIWFVPYGPMIIALIGLGALAYVGWLVYQAYQGSYPQKGLLTSMGAWILTLFDHQVTVTHV